MKKTIRTGVIAAGLAATVAPSVQALPMTPRATTSTLFVLCFVTHWDLWR
ncbi:MULTISPECIES: hypothetical protein [Thalassolituus]|nr:MULTISPECIES: hypothetical protein [Thalassolituus]